MFRGIDRSARLTGLVKRLSTGLSRRRGLPLLVAVGLTILSLIVHLFLAFAYTPALAACAYTLLHLAILAGFIGVLLIEPLGRG